MKNDLVDIRAVVARLGDPSAPPFVRMSDGFHAAKNHIPALCDEVEQLRNELEVVRRVRSEALSAVTDAREERDEARQLVRFAAEELKAIAGNHDIDDYSELGLEKAIASWNESSTPAAGPRGWMTVGDLVELCDQACRCDDDDYEDIGDEVPEIVYLTTTWTCLAGHVERMAEDLGDPADREQVGRVEDDILRNGCRHRIEGARCGEWCERETSESRRWWPL